MPNPLNLPLAQFQDSAGYFIQTLDGYDVGYGAKCAELGQGIGFGYRAAQPPGAQPGCCLYGVSDGSLSQTGQWGETLTALVALTNFGTTGVYTQGAVLNVTPGDWDIFCTMVVSANSSTMTSTANSLLAISATTASAAGTFMGQSLVPVSQLSLSGTLQQAISLQYPLNVNVLTPLYANVQATYTSGNPQYALYFYARRAR